MDVLEAIERRRSVRDFADENVPDDVVLKAIEAASHAPSAGNLQPWEFVIVRDREIKKKLVFAALDQTFIAEAPVVLVVCTDEKRSAGGYGQRGINLYCIQDTAAAIENLLLAIHSLGYGACWIGAFDEDEVRRVVNAPRAVRPVAIIPIGRPLGETSVRRKRRLEEFVHYETF